MHGIGRWFYSETIDLNSFFLFDKAGELSENAVKPGLLSQICTWDLNNNHHQKEITQNTISKNENKAINTNLL